MFSTEQEFEYIIMTFLMIIASRLAYAEDGADTTVGVPLQPRSSQRRVSSSHGEGDTLTVSFVRWRAGRDHDMRRALSASLV